MLENVKFIELLSYLRRMKKKMKKKKKNTNGVKTLGYSLEKPSPRIDACVDYESRTKCLESVNALLGLVWNDFIVRSTFNCGNFSLALCALSYCRFIEGICVLPICSCVLCSVMCTK